MGPSCAKISELPPVLKAAFVLFALHIALYTAYIAWVVSLGAAIHPLWIMHILIALYLTSEVRRPARRLAYALAGYCFVISFLNLRGEYLHAVAIDDFRGVLPRAILVHAPLLLAGICVVVGRKFYVRRSSAA